MHDAVGVTVTASNVIAVTLFWPTAFGPVVEIKLHKKGGYGFVKFELHDSAVKAIVEGHCRELQGRVLKCAWGKSAASSNNAAAAAPSFNLANTLQVGSRAVGTSGFRWRGCLWRV